jgi:hypothetical protein
VRCEPDFSSAPICKHPGGYQLPPRLPRVLCVGVVTASPPGRYPPRRRGAQKPEIQLFEHKARKSLPGRKKLSTDGLSPLQSENRHEQLCCRIPTPKSKSWSIEHGIALPPCADMLRMNRLPKLGECSSGPTQQNN